jgi:hypothetical protein
MLSYYYGNEKINLTVFLHPFFFVFIVRFLHPFSLLANYCSWFTGDD